MFLGDYLLCILLTTFDRVYGYMLAKLTYVGLTSFYHAELTFFALSVYLAFGEFVFFNYF